MSYTKYNRVITSLFICLLAVCFIIRPVTAQEKASSVINDRIEYYDSNPAYVAIDGSQVRTVVDMVDQSGEPFKIGFTLGNYYSKNIINNESTVVNVVIYDKNGKEIHTVGKKGNASGGGVRLNSVFNSIHARIMIDSKAHFYKNKETEGIVLLQSLNADRRVLEIELEPDFESQGINADIAIWNSEDSAQEFGVNYFHTVELDGDNKLPIKSLGENLGMYVENDKNVRINYTVNGNFDRRTQYTAESDYSISTLKAAFAGFQPSNSLGLGWETKANDLEGTTIYNASSSPAISLKVPFQKVASGDYLSLNFTTGLSVAAQPPTIKPVQNKYDSVEGNKVPIKVTWSDHGSSKNDEGTIVVSGEGIPDTEAVYLKTKDKGTKETGTELIELDTRQLSPGIHDLDLLITDATGATGHGKVQIDVKDGMKIELAEKLSGKVFDTIQTDYEAKVTGSYVIADIPYIVSQNKEPKRIIDMTTRGYLKRTKTITGNWTKEEADSGKRIINYYNYPTFTAEASVTKPITEEDAKTGTYKINGKWTNELKTGGKIIVRKGDKTLDTIEYPANQETGTWSVTIPKGILIPGKNIFDISMETKSNANYDSLVIKKDVTIEVLKHVNVRYFAINEDKSEVEIKKEELDDSPTFLDLEMNKEHTLKPKEMLASQKYVLNIEKSGANEQKEIKTLITIETDQINVYYNYNTIPLTIRYHNIDTKKKVFASVSESKRRVDRLVKDAVAGTPLTKVFTKEDKEAEGYDFHSLVDQSGDQISDDAVVPSKSAIYTVYFTSKYQIDAPESIDFGQMIIPENDQLQYPINPYEAAVINTVENEAGVFGSWDLVASFAGFYSGTVKLNADLKYADAVIEENTPVLKSKADTKNPKTTTPLTNDAKGLHLVVGGGNNLLGKYNGTIQWDLQVGP